MTRVRVATYAAVAVLGAGCTPAQQPADAGAPTSSRPAPASTTASPAGVPSPTNRRESMDIPDRVIMRQLRDAAERIAKQVPTIVPTPADISPGTNRALGYQMMLDFGFDADQWGALDALWHRESGWNHLAENPSSGAYGIPQSLPATKMAVVGPDWRTNPETQIQWGLAYISARYGNPNAAWAHSERVGWY